MHRRRLVMLPLVVALLASSPIARAASISSRILIDPTGEHTGDEFGRSVAWVGDVNGDGYDDLLSGAFRYPEIASVGQAYLYFGGPAIDAVADLVHPAPAGGSGWFGIRSRMAGRLLGRACRRRLGRRRYDGGAIRGPWRRLPPPRR